MMRRGVGNDADKKIWLDGDKLMTKQIDPADVYASEEETLALIRPDQRSDAEKKLDAMLEERGAWEQGADAYPILYQIAAELLGKQ